MAHPPPYPNSGDDTDGGSDRRSTTGAPRWVSILGIIIAIGLVLVIVALHLSGTIGPGAH